MQSKIPVQRALPIIRVFVSSTFSDLKHERNALHAMVWPDLERYCQQRGFTFQAIDLRWGVPAEAGLDHRTMRICFEELRRSLETSPEPNFLILLSNRYGWRPLPEVISVEEFEKLKAAAEQIQIEPPDSTRKPTLLHVELLKKAVAVLEDWYLLDENAKPFGEEFPIGEYILRSRKPLLNGVDYGRQPDAAGILRDTAAWVDVQFVLWSIVNRAYPASGLKDRFTAPFRDDAASDRSGTRESTDLKSHDFSDADRKSLPPSVRFQASATEQEIWHGALHAQGTEAKQHVIAWFREIDNLSDYPPGPQLKDFVDLNEGGTPDQDSKQALEQLKTELKQNLDAENVFTAKCRWNVEQQGPSVPDVTTDHLDEMCKQIRERLKEMIILQINAYWGCDLSADDATLAQVRGSQQELDLECADHLRFAGERAPEKTFVGRESELQRIRDYLRSKTNQPFVVHGPSGSGKTALLGKIIQEVTPPRSADGTRAKTGPIVLNRFIGTTRESSSLRSLLSSLCRELRQQFEMPAPLPTDLNELMDEFYSQLGKATAARPVFVFLDALDQLDDADRGRSVFWVRSPLPSTTDAACLARMVVSCLSPSDEFPEDSNACEPFRVLKLRELLGSYELGALDENDARQLFARWLHGAGRSASESQQDMIWSALQISSACRQPLFLKVLFEEARRWRSFDAPSAIPASLARLLDELFIRLGTSSAHGELIGIALSCLVSARYGLSEGELLEVLYADPEYKTILAEDNKRNGHELPPDTNRIPIAPWIRLRSDLAPYLSERAAPGTAVMHFYHRQVEQAVRQRYLRTPDQRTCRHRQLAEYFDGRWNGPDAHALMELPHLRLLCQDHDQLLHRLTDLQFPLRKTQAGYVSDLVRNVDDLRTRLSGAAGDSLAPWYFFIRGNAPFLAENPECFFQQAYNEPVDSPVSQAAQQRWSTSSGRDRPSDAATTLPRAFLEWMNRPTDWERPACLMTLQGHTDYVGSVALSADGRTIVSGSGDKTVKVWDAESGICRQTLQGHTDFVWSVALSADGRTIVSASANTLEVWDAESGACRQTLQGHTSYVDSVALSADGRTIVSGSYDKTVKVWYAESRTCRQTFQGHTERVRSVALSADGRTIVSGSGDKTVKVWDAESGNCRQTLQGHTGNINSVALSADGLTIVSGSSDKTVNVWDAESGTCRQALQGHTDWVRSVSLSADGLTIVSASEDQTLKVWDAESGTCGQTLLGHAHAVTSVALSADGRTIVSGSVDNTVKVWDAESGTCRQTFQRHTERVRSVALSADVRTIVSGSEDETVKVWDAESGTCRRTLQGHTNWVNSVALSADVRTIVSGSGDKTVKVWDAESGTCRQTLQGHTKWINRVALSADGRTIVSGSGDNTVKVWDAESGICRATHTSGSADALAAWRNVGHLDESRQLSTKGGLLQFPLALLPNKARRTDATAAVVESLIAPGNFEKAYGPLAADTILAFTANGEAHWFRLRQRDEA